MNIVIKTLIVLLTINTITYTNEQSSKCSTVASCAQAMQRDINSFLETKNTESEYTVAPPDVMGELRHINQLIRTAGKDDLKNAIPDLTQTVEKLNQEREGIFLKERRVAPSARKLQKQLENDYKAALTPALNAQPYQAYQYILLDPAKRTTYTTETIKKAAQDFRTTMIAQGIDDEKKLERARQADYILRNPVGKQNYDAYLDARENDWDALNALHILPDEKSKYGLDQDSIMSDLEQISTWSAEIGATTSTIKRKLK